MLSHGNADLDAGFEFKGEVVVVDRHPLKELPDKIIVVFLNIRLLGFQKSLDLIEVPLDACVVGILQKELLPLTGYVHGGCSPVGMKKPFPTFLHASAEGADRIFVSAGRVGFQMELSPKDLFFLVSFRYADLVTDSPE